MGYKPLTMSYFLISMKHTHPDDKFLTFWGPGNHGYTLIKEECGEYEDLEEGYHNSEHTLPVEKEKMENLFSMFRYGTERKMMVPNCESTWRQLGLKLTENGLRRA